MSDLPKKGDLVFMTEIGLKHSSAGAMPSLINTRTPLLVLNFGRIYSQQKTTGNTPRFFPWKNSWELHCLAGEDIFYLVLHARDVKLEDMITVVKP